MHCLDHRSVFHMETNILWAKSYLPPSPHAMLFVRKGLPTCRPTLHRGEGGSERILQQFGKKALCPTHFGQDCCYVRNRSGGDGHSGQVKVFFWSIGTVPYQDWYCNPRAEAIWPPLCCWAESRLRIHGIHVLSFFFQMNPTDCFDGFKQCFPNSSIQKWWAGPFKPDTPNRMDLR